MILIVTTTYERAVTNVCKWLTFYNIRFVRMTLNELLEAFYTFDLGTNMISFKTKSTCFSLDEIKAVWIRKANFEVENNKVFEYNNYNKEDLFRFLNQEIQILTNYIFHVLQSCKPFIGVFFSSGFNKLIVLKLAKDCGFSLPSTKIITNPKTLRIDNQERYITKPISEIFISRFGTEYFASYTSIIDNKDLNDEIIFPSLIQELIMKKSDLRVFIIGRNVYAVSINILNEGNIDWRHVSDKKNIFYLPYKLPHNIIEKIFSLMNSLNLRIGALDLIEDINGDIYFIEINPDGDFDMIQDTLGINIDEKIASYIIEIQNEKYENI